MYLDITFGLQVVESSSVVSREPSLYLLFQFPSKWFFCYLIPYFFQGPLTFCYT